MGLALVSNLKNMEWLKNNGCPWNKSTLWMAVNRGNLAGNPKGCQWIKEYLQ